MSDPAETKAGYKKPPIANQFKKGRSGNPSSRRKSDTKIGSLLEKVLSKKIRFSENGKRRTITKLEGVLHVLVTEALKGNIAAAKLILGHDQLLEEIKKHAKTEFVFRLNAIDMQL